MIEWLPSQLGVEAIGGKGRGLSQLLAWGFKVPPAFVIDARHIARVAEFTHDDWQTVFAGWEQLGSGVVAVRSSGVDEDSASTSFAGVHETFLGVDSPAALRAAIQQCAQSATSERARAYRQRLQGAQGNSALAVIVQSQIPAELAGVTFTADPLSGSKDKLLVEAVQGLGERLVSGHAKPDRVWFDRQLRQQSNEGAGGCLSAIQAHRVAECALAIERHAGCPVDIEWCMQGTDLWLLQWRPITTTFVPRTVWTNTNAAELLPDVAKPLVFEIVERAVGDLFAPILEPMGMGFGAMDVIGQVRGRIYFKVNSLVAWMRTTPGMAKQNIALFAEGLGGDQARLTEAVGLLRPEDLPRPKISKLRLMWGILSTLWGALRYGFIDPEPPLRQAQVQRRRLAGIDLSRMNAIELADHLHVITHKMFGPEMRPVLFSLAMGSLALGAMSVLCRRWLNDTQGSLVQQMLQGIDGLDSAAAGLALADLATLARRDGLVGYLNDVANAHEGREETLLNGLRRLDNASAFCRAFDDFMAEHGHHARGEIDVSVSRWSEEPAYILRQVRFAAIAQPQTKLNHNDRVEQRHELLRNAFAPLSPWRRALLRVLLKRSEVAIAGRENNKSEAIRRLALVRRLLKRIAEQLQAAGLLNAPDDIWYLQLDEIDCALRQGVVDQQLVQHRRTEHDRYQSEPPPPSVVVEGVRFLHSTQPLTVSDQWQGVAASPGVVDGIARVVLHTNDADGVLPGEILVAPHTDPGWTPYFLNALAVVTEFGGVLSHGAVVAREYGLPCVVNVRGVTQRIQSGQRIRVDGGKGQVSLLQ